MLGAIKSCMQIYLQFAKIIFFDLFFNTFKFQKNKHLQFRRDYEALLNLSAQDLRNIKEKIK